MKTAKGLDLVATEQLLIKARVLELAITGMIADLEHSEPDPRSLRPVLVLADEIVTALQTAAA